MAAQEQQRERVVPLGRLGPGSRTSRTVRLSPRGAGGRSRCAIRRPAGASSPRSMSHARGLSGMPSSRHCRGGGEQRLLHGVLARRRTARTAGRARRGPAAPARAAGPRRGVSRPATRWTAGGPTRASAARSSVAMSIFFIWSIACMARCALSGSGSLSSSVRRVGMICHDRPYRSFSQPHGPSSPPFVSAAQSSSTSSCVSQFTTNEIASVNVWCWPAVQRGELLPVEPERHGHGGSRGCRGRPRRSA